MSAAMTAYLPEDDALLAQSNYVMHHQSARRIPKFEHLNLEQPLWLRGTAFGLRTTNFSPEDLAAMRGSPYDSSDAGGVVRSGTHPRKSHRPFVDKTTHTWVSTSTTTTVILPSATVQLVPAYNNAENNSGHYRGGPQSEMVILDESQASRSHLRSNYSTSNLPPLSTPSGDGARLPPPTPPSGNNSQPQQGRPSSNGNSNSRLRTPNQQYPSAVSGSQSRMTDIHSNLGGTTTKETFVTRQTTSVDPRTLPGFYNKTNNSSADDTPLPVTYANGQPHRAPSPPRGAVTEGPMRGVPHGYPSPVGPPAVRSQQQQQQQYNTNGGADVESVDSSGHRLRKKYTTTTVTTVTTTTILLPKMQEAYVMPSQTQHAIDSNNSNYNNKSSAAITNGSSNNNSGALTYNSNNNDGQMVPQQHQSGQWAYQQGNSKSVEQTHSERQPTLQDLGISSYFNRSTNEVNEQRGGAYHHQPHPSGNSVNMNGSRQPWIRQEVRDEVEGGHTYRH